MDRAPYGNKTSGSRLDEPGALLPAEFLPLPPPYGRIDKEVMYRIHALKTSRRIPAFVPSTRMEGILDELDRESESPEFKFVRNSLIVLLFYSCGLRLAELVGIDRDDFSGDYTALKVRGKGDKERIVPILPPVREKILHYLDEIDRQGICISKEKALFLNQQGKRISRSTVYRTVQSQLRQGGVQGKRVRTYSGTPSPPNCSTTAPT